MSSMDGLNVSNKSTGREAHAGKKSNTVVVTQTRCSNVPASVMVMARASENSDCNMYGTVRITRNRVHVTDYCTSTIRYGVRTYVRYLTSIFI